VPGAEPVVGVTNVTNEHDAAVAEAAAAAAVGVAEAEAAARVEVAEVEAAARVAEAEARAEAETAAVEAQTAAAVEVAEVVAEAETAPARVTAIVPTPDGAGALLWSDGSVTTLGDAGVETDDDAEQLDAEHAEPDGDEGTAVVVVVPPQIDEGGAVPAAVRERRVSAFRARRGRHR
jgi:multidrug efflux pump subunit AcrA (membrane-fusion protein)